MDVLRYATAGEAHHPGAELGGGEAFQTTSS